MNRRLGVLVAFGVGFIALSYEILWYRAVSVALLARPHAFGVVLGGYLTGIAAGAYLSGRFCVRDRAPADLSRTAGWLLVGASATGFLLVPVLARILTTSRNWAGPMLLLAAGASALGGIFPLLAHATIRQRDRVGAWTGYLYLANIVGSAAGSLLTGLWLLDLAGLPTLITGVSVGGAFLGGSLIVGAGSLLQVRTLCGVAAVVLLLILMPVGQTAAFAELYDRLFFRLEYRGSHFTEVIETRSGVIGVTADEAVYGAGVHDGYFNTDLHKTRVNIIHRAYAIGAFHSQPRRVLMIGLSSGSWAAVIANHPQVESLTVVEINPGYLELIARRPAVAGILEDPRVRIDIADGRRWLLRHPHERFDLIVANTTYHWRANASSLLSVEFLGLIRGHLNRGGVYYFNTTSEPRVHRTAAEVFPHAWRVYSMMAVSDTPIDPDMKRFSDQLAAYRLYDGRAALDLSREDDRQLHELLVSDFAADLEPRDRILQRTAGLAPITDDNMGTEWRLKR
jgi:spermidine synthase